MGVELDRAGLDARFADWLRRIDAMHVGARHLANPSVAFAPLPRPLGEARVALLTTAGAYVHGQEPFDVANPAGDPSFRVIGDDVEPSQLAFAHTHYDTSRAEDDPDVVLPIGPLHALVAEGLVGASSPVHVGMMGFNPDPQPIVDETAPAVVDLFERNGVDVVVLSPG